MNWLYDVVPEWFVYLIAAWFALSAIFIMVVTMRAYSEQLFGPSKRSIRIVRKDSEQAHGHALWLEDRIGPRSFSEPAAKRGEWAQRKGGGNGEAA